jgi:aminoglycoside phosphotransferase (APT) family kinase protein
MHGPRAVRKAVTSTSVVGWLVCDHGYPATAPLPAAPPVVVDASTVVTFWVYYPQPADARPPSSARLARLLRTLHDLPPAPADLDVWVPLRSLCTAVREAPAAGVLSPDDRDWLLTRIDAVRAALAALDWPLGHGLIHGDAWAGNLLRDTAAGPDAVVLADWDSVCRGPREVDLVPTWHAARRYGRGPAWADAFADVYGHDLAAWPGFETLYAMRDLVQLIAPLRRAPHDPILARVLYQRLAGIQRGDTTETWQAV